MYNIKQAKRDIDAVYSMGLFDDVNILPSPSEDSNLENPKVWLLSCTCCPQHLLEHEPAASLGYKILTAISHGLLYHRQFHTAISTVGTPCCP